MARRRRDSFRRRFRVGVANRLRGAQIPRFVPLRMNLNVL